MENEDLLKVAEICSKKEFFKRVAGGEAMGRAIFENWGDMPQEEAAVKTINQIVNWINYGKDTRISE